MTNMPEESYSSQEVTAVETFFDLVYVFAISQLAEHLAEHLTWRGAAQTLLLLVSVFTIWSFTTLESTMALARKASAQWVILAVMVLGLVMNASIPSAFGDGPWSFVVPMIAIQIGRSAATSRVDVLTVLRRHRFAMGVWALFSAVPWCLGALAANPDHRLWWWLLAVVIDLTGAVARHPLPGFAQEGLDEIRFDVPHQVERNRLFLLICFGEAIVRAGVGLAGAPQDGAHIAAAVTSMVSLICVWLLFFGNSRAYADQWLEHPGGTSESQLGRLATYGQQFLMIAFVAYAVGTELAVEEPHRSLGMAGTALLFGGMALCLASYMVFLIRLTGRRLWPDLLGGTIALVVLAVVVVATGASSLVATCLLAVCTAVTAGVHDRTAPRLAAAG